MKPQSSQSTSLGGRRFSRRSPRSRSRGVALIVTLILLVLLSAASLAMFLLVFSDTMINGYYRNYRGSFYAADSGVNVVVEALKNAVQNGAVTDHNPPLAIANGTTMPALAGSWTSAGAYPTGLTAAYAKFQGNYYTIGDAGSWASKFEVLAANPDGQPILGTAVFTLAPHAGDSNACWPSNVTTCQVGGKTVTNDYDYDWTFAYPYEVTVQGISSGGEQEEIVEKGTILYASTTGTTAAGNSPNFAVWAAFITNYAPCIGALVPGAMSGPFFTGGQWGFGNYSNPGYTFTGSVQQVGTNVSWYPGSGCTQSPTLPKGMKSPNFEAGPLVTGANPIVPPSNSYNQEQAVLDGKGAPPCTAAPCSPDPAPTQTEMNQVLKTVSGTSYPSSGTPSSGVYLPYYTSGTSPSGQTCTASKPCFGSSPSVAGGDGSGGGFYVQGNASVTLTATTDTGGNNTQTYSITQGGTTTKIVVDDATGTTTVSSGATSVTLQGVPTQLDPNTGAPITQTDPSGNPVDPTMVYVNGTITGLSGTVQNNTGVTITGTSNIDINGNLTYAQEPVSVPSDTLSSTTNAGVIGVYTATGNIVLSSPYSNNNLEVDGSLAAIGGSCASNSCGFTVSGSINTFNNVGGQIQTNIFSANMSAENTYYDGRFANNFGPPWFPTAVPQPGVAPVPTAGSGAVLRTSWREVR